MGAAPRRPLCPSESCAFGFLVELIFSISYQSSLPKQLVGESTVPGSVCVHLGSNLPVFSAPPPGASVTNCSASFSFGWDSLQEQKTGRESGVMLSALVFCDLARTSVCCSQVALCPVLMLKLSVVSWEGAWRRWSCCSGCALQNQC